MSISYTHTTLTDAILIYAEENDSEFVSSVDDFIGKGELRILRDLDLEIFEQWLVVEIPQSVRNVSKPANVIEVNSLFIRDPVSLEWAELPRRSFEYCLSYAPKESEELVPAYFSEFDEDTLYVVPTPDQNYISGNAKIRATIRPSGLSGTNTTTHLSQHFGDLLFSSCMIAAWEHLKNEAKLQESAKIYQSLLPSISKEVEDTMRRRYKGLNSTPGADN